MSHLTLEEIARLVDEQAAPAEAAHLEHCETCRAELDDMRSDSARLASLPPLNPPTSEWPALRGRLAREGLIHTTLRSAWRTRLLRAAAAIATFSLGTLAGAAWTDRDQAPAIANVDAQGSVLQPVIDSSLPDLSERLGAEDASTEASRDTQSRYQLLPADAQLASTMITAREPRTPEEAQLLAREIEALYYEVVSRVSAGAFAAADAGDPYTRLAVLEGITTLTGTALGRAPADPILNGYHVAALAQREATLRQIAARTSGNWF